MGLRFVIVFGAGIVCGVALKWGLELRQAGGRPVDGTKKENAEVAVANRSGMTTSAVAAKASAGVAGGESLMIDVPYVPSSPDLVPSLLLVLLAVYREDGNEPIPLVRYSDRMVSALALTENEVKVTSAYLRRVVDNWTYVVKLSKSGESRWELSYSESAAKATLKDIAQWAEETLGARRGYLFMVLMEHDFRALFLPEDVILERESDLVWSLTVGQEGHTYELKDHQAGSPMMRLKAKCEGR
ncbi:hypothetical protein [Prosthecobacter sp.]|uniref:hypothetical protein n=1 Tax=Prosthecobacter sp. TaxID=1965333 RepID=UPI00378466DD